MEPKILGIIFALASTIILAYLFCAGKFDRKIGYVFALFAALLGFIIFSPMLPLQLQTFILGNQAAIGVPLPVAIFGLLVFIVLALVLGRLLCGYLCPIGALQELVYSIPGKKLDIKHKWTLMAIRVGFFAMIIAAGILYSTAMLEWLGVKDFFKVIITVPFWIFATMLIASIFVYRPFCRLACPYGVFLSLSSAVGIFKLRRNDKCINCEKCEKACPTGEAGRDDKKMECYMCNRCVEVCPVDAIEYKR